MPIKETKCKTCGADSYIGLDGREIHGKYLGNTPDWEISFDKEFEGIYYGKDNDGYPIYPSENFKLDVKQFISSLLKSERERIMKEVMGLLPEEKTKNKLCTNEQTWYFVDGWNECLKQIKNKFYGDK